MAFQKAAGWGNLPNGNFSPVIYSKKVQLALRESVVCSDITNSDYFGEIANYGDTVRIMKEPEIEITDYARGAQVDPQDLDDEDFLLTIDKANKFSFKMDDLERAHSHIGFMELASNRGGFNLANEMDREVLGYICGYKQSTGSGIADTVNDIVNGTVAVDTAGTDELLASMKLSRPNFGNIATAGSTGDSIPIAARLPGASVLPTTYVSPVMLINRMARLLDLQNVPADGRWIVISPQFEEILKDEDSRFHNADFGPNGSLRSGATPMQIGGFRVYKSNNLPSVGTGPSTTGTGDQGTNYGVIVAGRDDAVATAEQISKTEDLRSHNFFGDIVRGLHVYGRKILRPESIVTARYNLA